ncbi:hypothetical protein COU15_02430 [Candidatus Kaiserbacteria bacterium CG10_big_fil_rev_8_21_14_0_10_45_20]|uniref:Tr-type G domain-containing protein n=1 Tax=Candidatus Kaiserbacteria bacterium CG10_big_fil_rev_8_21_14_0_10_45_20 TaxID=1974607 RepID=A0A2H0UFC4_9BACT|nr:MAG: hypothetical protein COU15_02430 [Candidatus Kaiserbacteria bacterium CG10_big_fil_rev_8_21_14_0_10_45_20]
MSMTDKTPTYSQPVIAVVGHIDHGKTSLLDYIRKSRVAEKETGGITQRISAYEISHTTKEGAERDLTFIDTPGHEAFQKMRRRGASSADIAILVVAADDGVKPQTKEAWSAIQDAGIPCVVAFTKIDKESANLDRAKEAVLTEGIYLEGLGGSVPWTAVSSKTGDGIPDLLDLLVLVSDLEEVVCDPLKPARAVVIESARDPKIGISATVIVREGTLKTGAFAVAGTAWAPLRAIVSADGTREKELSCGKPAFLSGFSEEPEVGAELITVATKKEAEALAKEASVRPENVPQNLNEASEKVPIRIILKADTMGSIEALEFELEKVPAENADITIVSKSVGAVSENDVKTLSSFDNAIILAFGVGTDASAEDLAERQGVHIESRKIIYELTEWLTKEVETRAPGIPEEKILGRAKILKFFSNAGNKHVVGGRLEEGIIKKGSTVSIIRRDIPIGKGKIINMQSQKTDVDSISTEKQEFGAQIESRSDIAAGDIIEISTTIQNK